MLKEFSRALALLLCGLLPAAAETLQLKEKAAITGKILAEKSDQIAIDVGYTVLVIPRNQISKILRTEAEEAPPKAARTAAADKKEKEPESRPGFYAAPRKSAPARSVRDLVNVLGEAVVQVRTPGGLGSGFIINEDGFLLTNRKSYKQVRIIAINKFEDMALLRIEDKDAPKFKYLLMGSADALSVGERVFAIGSPLGLERTVTEGILSTKTRQMAGELYLQTTTQINPGNSGGPLFNMSGEVVGITNMKITFGEGLGFAIPIESVKFFLDHRDAYAYANDNPSNPYRYLEPPSRTRQTAAEQ
jgi:serine protease Do